MVYFLMSDDKLRKPITRISYISIILNTFIGIWFIALGLILRPFLVIYVAPLASGRVGHFVLDTEILLARLSEMSQRRRKVIVFWIPESVIINSCVYDIWREKIKVVRFSRVSKAILLTAVYCEKLTKLQMTLRFEGWDGYLGYTHLLNKYPPVFQMIESDKKQCEKLLQEIGIDTAREWVCILSRDSAYLEKTYPKSSWGFNSYRNSSINTYLDAAEFLAKEGLTVFRMGRIVEEGFKSLNSNLVVDYANSNWKSDKMDVYLSLHCKFFLSSSTGLDAIAYAARKPIVTVNLAQPLTAIYTKPNHLFILKKFMLDNSFISIRKYLSIGIEENGFTLDNPRNLRSQDLDRLQIKVFDNTSEEILDATKEMFFLLQSGGDFSKLSDAQTKFWQNFPSENTQIFGKPASRIGRKFIHQNSWLLD